MGISRYFSFSWLHRLLKKPGFWFILALLVIISLPYYNDALKYPPFIVTIMTSFKLERQVFERILYLAPIVWAGFIFGWRGAFAISLVALALMLPRVAIFSDSQRDALVEISAIFIVGNALSISFASLRREREYRHKLEATHEQLITSEAQYRQLFENANEGIWIHDLEGNFIAANSAGEKMTGYSVKELRKMNVKSFLSPESLELARQIREKILKNEPVQQPYEQRAIRRDGTEMYIEISTNLLGKSNMPDAFQNIARDITEQKRMAENLHFYLQQATKAQEEERKRISHELHDDTIQGLVVLSRQLDALGSEKDLPEKGRILLEELWQQTDNILQGVRRLSQDLRPAALDRLGLLPAIQWLAEEVSRYSGISTKVNVIGQEHRLPEELSIALFRITQEALRNVWRHSGATSAQIIIEFFDIRTIITVSDNGKGFKLTGKVGDLAKHGKLGLAGMQERAQLIGGTLVVQSEPDKGTSISVEAPG